MCGYCIRQRRTSARAWGFESLALRNGPAKRGRDSQFDKNVVSFFCSLTSVELELWSSPEGIPSEESLALRIMDMTIEELSQAEKITNSMKLQSFIVELFTHVRYTLQ